MISHTGYTILKNPYKEKPYIAKLHSGVSDDNVDKQKSQCRMNERLTIQPGDIYNIAALKQDSAFNVECFC